MTTALAVLFVLGIFCAYMSGFYSGKAKVYGEWKAQARLDLDSALHLAETIREWEQEMREKE